jgi:iron complex outermembrane receptor protein
MGTEAAWAKFTRCVLAVCFWLPHAVASEKDAETRYDLQIPRLRADVALRVLAQQTDRQLLFPYDLLKALETSPLSGRCTVEEALEIMLRGTGLTVSLTQGGVITVTREREAEVGMDSNERKARSLGTLRALLASLLGLTGTAGEAQPLDGSQLALEEIIVTAQKREQSIQDVGIAITAFTGDELRRLGVEQSIDVARLTPGLHISANQGGQKQLFTIRGVNQNDGGHQTESPIAMYVDEAYVAIPQAQLFGLFDIERVEVLKGPQGTLFGRNATGGLLHFVTRKPGESFDMSGDLTYGSYDQVRFESGIGGPLTQTVGGRVAVMYNRFDGYLENTYPDGFRTLTGSPLSFGGEDGGNDETLGIRAHVLFEPNENVDFLLSANYARTRIGTPAIVEIPSVPVFNEAGVQIDTVNASPDETREAIGPGEIALNVPFSLDPDPFRPVPGGTFYGATCTPIGIENLECSADSAFKDVSEDNVYGVTGKLTWALGDTTLTSVTSYQYVDSYHQLDGDSGPVTTLSPLQNLEDSDTFTQEVRFNTESSRFRWVGGGYYLYVSALPRFGLKVEPQSLFLPLFGVPVDVVVKNRLRTESWSIFGQLEFDLTNTLTVIGGLRATFEDKNYSTEEVVYLNTDPKSLSFETKLFAFLPERDFEQDDTLWSGKVQLDWHPTNDLLLYAGINRGIKAGGFNAVVTIGAPFDDSVIPYLEEVLLSYETGFKSTFWNGTTRLNGSFYLYDYEDYQGYVFRTASGIISNVDADYKGFELELISSPVTGLDLALNLAYLDAEVSDMQIGPGVFRDNKPSYSPKHQVSGLVRYEWPTPILGGHVSVHADFNYASSYFADLRNFQAHEVDSYVLGNARIGWRSADGKWDLAFFVNNISDKRYTTVIVDTANLFGSVSEGIGRPRWFGASIRYNFF